MCFWIFYTHKNKSINVRSNAKRKKNNAYKEMHDAQIHNNEASNA